MDLVRPDIDGYLAAFAAHDDPVLREMERLAARRDLPLLGRQVGRRPLRPGGLFITDNMLWDGRVLDPSSDDRVTRGVLELTAALNSAPDFAVSIVPIRDGVAIAVRLAL